MTRAQLQALIHRLEGFARRHPGAYRLRVALLAALGYGFLLLFLALMLGLLAFVVVAFTHVGPRLSLLKIGIVAAVMALWMAGALWVRFPAPAGIELKREEAPELFRMLDEVRTRLKAPRFEQVMVTSEFNAGAAQRPRLGVLGWQRNHLLLGLPLMQALPPDQFRAIVGHELGHLSGKHGRFSGWIYRVDAAWGRLLASLKEGESRAAGLFERFYRWFVPLFDAYSFVLRRDNEYVADRCAAEVAGNRTAAQALMRTEVAGRLLSQRYWPDVYDGAKRDPEPPGTVFSGMAARLREGPTPEEDGDWLRQALSEKTGLADTHPALGDRLRGMGLGPKDARELLTAGADRVAVPETTAADAYLGARAAALTCCLDAFWKLSAAAAWGERHSRAQEARKRLDLLDEKSRAGSLPPDEAFQRARLTLEFRGAARAAPILREILVWAPGHAGASYVLGRLLLDEKDDAGIALVEAAMEQEPDSVLPGCEALFRYLKRQGRDMEAERYLERAVAHTRLLQQDGRNTGGK